MSLQPIEDLAQRISAALRADPKGVEVPELLKAYARRHDDWERCASFSSGLYTRHLMAGCQLFELLLLCWAPDQRSPIHDHQGQRCWMAVLEGEVLETHFRQPPDGGPLVRGLERAFPAGGVAFISDDIALHEIRPARDRPCATLHLYSRPIPECRVFDEATGAVRRRRLAYDSVRAGAHALV